jgi:hypothetical protein
VYLILFERQFALTRVGGFFLGDSVRENLAQSWASKESFTFTGAVPVGLGAAPSTNQPHALQPQADKGPFSSQTSSLAIPQFPTRPLSVASPVELSQKYAMACVQETLRALNEKITASELNGGLK